MIRFKTLDDSFQYILDARGPPVVQCLMSVKPHTYISRSYHVSSITGVGYWRYLRPPDYPSKPISTHHSAIIPRADLANHVPGARKPSVRFSIRVPSFIFEEDPELTRGEVVTDALTRILVLRPAPDADPYFSVKHMLMDMSRWLTLYRPFYLHPPNAKPLKMGSEPIARCMRRFNMPVNPLIRGAVYWRYWLGRGYVDPHFLPTAWRIPPPTQGLAKGGSHPVTLRFPMDHPKGQVCPFILKY